MSGGRRRLRCATKTTTQILAVASGFNTHEPTLSFPSDHADTFASIWIPAHRRCIRGVCQRPADASNDEPRAAPGWRIHTGAYHQLRLRSC